MSDDTATPHDNDRDDHRDIHDDSHSVAVIGAGSAGEALLRELAGSAERIVIFEPEFVRRRVPFPRLHPEQGDAP